MQIKSTYPCRLLAACILCVLPAAFSFAHPVQQQAIPEFFSPAYAYTLSVTPQEGQPFTINIRPGTLFVIEAPESSRPSSFEFPRQYSGDLVLRAHPPDAVIPGKSDPAIRALSAASFRLRFENAQVIVHRKPLDLAHAQ